MIAIDDLMNIIDSKCCNKKITISGGEPLEQMDNLIVLISRLKKNGYNYILSFNFKMTLSNRLKFS